MGLRPTYITRNVFFVLLGVAGLVLKRQYAGPFAELVSSYGGNATASFAIYFIVRLVSFPRRFNRLASALIALLVVSLFEATNGFFGLMANTYDPYDFLANTAGIGLAVAVDLLVPEFSGSPDGGEKKAAGEVDGST